MGRNKLPRTPAEFMTTTEVARVLGVCCETVVRMVTEGVLPALKIQLGNGNGYHRIPRDAFAKWVAERTQGAS